MRQDVMAKHYDLEAKKSDSSYLSIEATVKVTKSLILISIERALLAAYMNFL